MIEKDTVRLLRECDSGAKMGIQSLQDVQDRVKDDNMRRMLLTSVDEHEKLSHDIQEHLHRFDDEGKDPSVMASGMAWLKAHAEMMMNGSDETIADLMTDGCNMGIKSLSRYLNQYTAADEKSKDFAKRLIGMEEHLVQDLRAYL